MPKFKTEDKIKRKNSWKLNGTVVELKEQSYIIKRNNEGRFVSRSIPFVDTLYDLDRKANVFGIRSKG